MLPDSFTPSLLKQLELLRLRSRRTFLGSRQGGHLSLKRGHGQEFSDYRKYELGDHPRYIDWGVYARSERLYVKRFQEEQDLPVLIILDNSASMDAMPQEQKFARSKEICLALAYIALAQQDTVSISTFDQVTGPKYCGLNSIHQISKRLETLQVCSKAEFFRAMQQIAASLKFPGVAVVISDFMLPLIEISRAFNALRSRNLDITAVQVLGQSDLTPLVDVGSAIAIDSESGEEILLENSAYLQQEYERQLAAHNKSLREFFSNNSVAFTSVVSSNPLSSLLISNLSKVGILT